MKTYKKRSVLLIASLILLMALTVGGSLSYLTASQSATNTFTVAAAPAPSINESFDGTTKSNVSVSVTGDVDSYVRVKLAIYFQDDDGNVVAKTPVENVDYTMSLNSGWTELGGYYYYNGVVKPENSTTVLVNNITTLNSQYRLVVDVIAQTIQAGGNAAKDAWGCVYSDGVWTAVSAS